jgi:hypothetical protein
MSDPHFYYVSSKNSFSYSLRKLRRELEARKTLAVRGKGAGARGAVDLVELALARDWLRKDEVLLWAEDKKAGIEIHVKSLLFGEGSGVKRKADEVDEEAGESGQAQATASSSSQSSAAAATVSTGEGEADDEVETTVNVTARPKKRRKRKKNKAT